MDGDGCFEEVREIESRFPHMHRSRVRVYIRFLILNEGIGLCLFRLLVSIKYRESEEAQNCR